MWAQNIKNVALINIGDSFECIKQIPDQAEEDPGFKLVMQAVDPATQLQRTPTASSRGSEQRTNISIIRTMAAASPRWCESP